MSGQVCQDRRIRACYKGRCVRAGVSGHVIRAGV